MRILPVIGAAIAAIGISACTTVERERPVQPIIVQPAPAPATVVTPPAAPPTVTVRPSY